MIRAYPFIFKWDQYSDFSIPITSSTIFKSGEYGGKKIKQVWNSFAISSTSFLLCILALSSTNTTLFFIIGACLESYVKICHKNRLKSIDVFVCVFPEIATARSWEHTRINVLDYGIGGMTIKEFKSGLTQLYLGMWFHPRENSSTKIIS